MNAAPLPVHTVGMQHPPGAPSNMDKERAVLGHILQTLDGAEMARSAGLVRDAFFFDRHKHVFDAVCRLEPADVGLLNAVAELRRMGRLEAVGGPEQVAILLEHACQPHALPGHVRDLLELVWKRDGLNLVRTAGEILHGDSNAAEARASIAAGLATFIGVAPGVLDLVGSASAFEKLTAGAVRVPESTLGNGLICLGDLAVLGGPPGVGKSRLVLELACAIAHGNPWLGWPTGGKPRRVAVVAAEFTSYRFMQRCVQLFGAKAPPDDPEQLLEAYRLLDLAGEGGAFMAIPGEQLAQPLDLLAPTGAYALERLIRTHRLDFVVLDPLARLMGGREETNEAFARLVVHLDRVRFRTAAAILLVHHVRKSGAHDRGKADPLDTLRGGTVLRDQVNTLLMATRTPGHLRRIDCAKSNYAAEPAPLFYSIPEGGGPTVVEQAPEDVANANRARVLAFVVAQGGRLVTATEVARALPGAKKDTPMDVKTARGHLEVLASKRELEDVEGPKKGTHLYRSALGTGKLEGIAVPPSSQAQGDLGDWEETRTLREWDQQRDEGEGRREPLKGPLGPPSSPPWGVPVVRFQTGVQVDVGTPTQATEERHHDRQ